jgi:hypothetical protein
MHTGTQQRQALRLAGFRRATDLPHSPSQVQRTRLAAHRHARLGRGGHAAAIAIAATAAAHGAARALRVHAFRFTKRSLGLR